MIVRLIGILAALVIAAPLAAKKPPSEFVQLRDGAPVTLQPDKAYLLMRMFDPHWAVFLLRVPTAQEMIAYESAKRAAYDKNHKKDETYEKFVFEWDGASNFYEVRPSRAYTKAEAYRTFLVETPPGEYVLYGYGDVGFLYQCNCLGSASFKAEAGRIVDLGSLLIWPAWKDSPFPELAAETGLGDVVRMDYPLRAVGVRPVRPDDAVPPQLAGMPRDAAHWKAVGPWVDSRRILVNRLAAIPGVLEYREGIVVDATTGEMLRLLPQPPDQ